MSEKCATREAQADVEENMTLPGSLFFDWKGDEASPVKWLLVEKADAFPS